MTEATATTTGASFLVGVALGVALVAPAVSTILASLPSLSSLDSTGLVLVGGVLALVVFVLGVFLLYVGFLAFE